jgi:predicted dehydrogenase
MIRIGLIGFGYWGPNIAKNLSKIENTEFTLIVDSCNDNLKKAKKLFSNIKISTNLKDSINDADAFIVATPIETHAEIAKLLLEHNKHVLIQKPMAHSHAECDKLNKIAKKKNKVLMVAHTFIFSPAIQKIKKDININNYGDLNYISSTRVNLGLFQRFHNVVWDLAPHDFSIIRYLHDEKPLYISATGTAHTNSKLIDCANITIGYKSNFMAMISINWLSPIKIRNFIISGSKKTALYDDCSLDKIRIYDSGVEYNNDVFTYKKGDVYIPKLEEKESIYFECLEFINSIQEKRDPISNGFFGKEIVKMIELTNKSIALNGRPVNYE